MKPKQIAASCTKPALPPQSPRASRWSRRGRRVLGGFLLFLLGGILTVLVLVIVALNERPDLSPWHTTILPGEFTAKSGDLSFADYLAREDQLFRRLEATFYSPSAPSRHEALLSSRFQAGNEASPLSRQPNWNRSFELSPPSGNPHCAVLLLHGMSDSPYSLRALGESLAQDGAQVLCPRLPGHGTVPSGLLEVTDKDLLAATRLGIHHLHQKLPDRPLFLLAYSNGAALALHACLDAIEDPALPRPAGVVLLSPAIGVSPMARLAAWQGRAGTLARAGKTRLEGYRR